VTNTLAYLKCFSAPAPSWNEIIPKSNLVKRRYPGLCYKTLHTCTFCCCAVIFCFLTLCHFHPCLILVAKDWLAMSLAYRHKLRWKWLWKTHYITSVIRNSPIVVARNILAIKTDQPWANPLVRFLILLINDNRHRCRTICLFLHVYFLTVGLQLTLLPPFPNACTLTPSLSIYISVSPFPCSLPLLFRFDIKTLAIILSLSIE